MPKSAVEEFVDAHGPATLAEATNKTPSAVRLWKHRHVIPRAAWPELIEAVPGLTMDALKEIETLSAPFAERKRATA